MFSDVFRKNSFFFRTAFVQTTKKNIMIGQRQYCPIKRRRCATTWPDQTCFATVRFGKKKLYENNCNSRSLGGTAEKEVPHGRCRYLDSDSIFCSEATMDVHIFLFVYQGLLPDVPGIFAVGHLERFRPLGDHEDLIMASCKDPLCLVMPKIYRDLFSCRRDAEG